ncbi:MAG: peptidoglycan DD-metalloendopeptidase family protein [Campylobacterales bacterium]|nr:peptidoglycan DD-metalloendopeptidase family protein [Campylobacterales bacterium]
MKLIIAICVIAVSLLPATTTTQKIKESKKAINQSDKEVKTLKKKLEGTKQNITKAKSEIKVIDTKLTKLSRDYVYTEDEYQKVSREVREYEKILLHINQELKVKHDALIALFAEQLSLIAAMKQFNDTTQSSVISQEVYEQYRLYNQKKIISLEKEILSLEATKTHKTKIANHAKEELSMINKQRKTFAMQKANQEKMIEKLNKEEERYQAELNRVAKRQDALRSTLVKLNILRANEVAEARRRELAQKEAIRLEAARKKRLREQQANAKNYERKTGKKVDMTTLEASKQSDRVRQINSSYQAQEVFNYQGTKTISPISGARVTKRFGTYEDPVYKIKIFNESVTLQAPSSDAQVVSVLDGKVVYAGNSSMLGKVVVIAHSGNMHTVYAGLSKIPPTIRVGSTVSKGYTIGKVSTRLIFEATKNSKHIDPLKLIRI